MYPASHRDRDRATMKLDYNARDTIGDDTLLKTTRPENATIPAISSKLAATYRHAAVSPRNSGGGREPSLNHQENEIPPVNQERIIRLGALAMSLIDRTSHQLTFTPRPPRSKRSELKPPLLQPLSLPKTYCLPEG